MRYGLYGLKGANFHLLELELGVTPINHYIANLQYKGIHGQAFHAGT